MKIDLNVLMFKKLGLFKDLFNSPIKEVSFDVKSEDQK